MHMAIRALAAVPFVIVLAACGSGSTSSTSSSAAPESSSAVPSSVAGDGCAKATMGLQMWYLDQAGTAIALTESGAITPETKTGMTELATTFDGYAADLEGGFSDASPAYAALANTIRQEAEVLRTWPDANTTTDGLAAALDEVTTSPEASAAFQEVVTDLEARCAPWRWG